MTSHIKTDIVGDNLNNKYNPRALALVLRVIYYRGKHHMKEGNICAVLDINTGNLRKSLFLLARNGPMLATNLLCLSIHWQKQPVSRTHNSLHAKLASTQMREELHLPVLISYNLRELRPQ